MTCSLCNLQCKFAKSHVIPEAFWRELRDGNHVPLLISSSEGSFPKRSPIGVYDQTILCEVCETIFNKMDDYGIEILLKRRKELFNQVSHEGELVGWKSNLVDQHRLLVFLVGILWRASVSTHIFFKRVNLGPLELLARKVVMNQEEAVPAEFGAVLSQWRTNDEHRSLTKGLMDPFKEKWGDATAYRFYFGEVVAYIKADKRPFPREFKQCSLGAHESLTIVSRDFSRSNDFRALRHTAIKSHFNHEAFNRRCGK
jgi:hypothetical protein